MDTIEEVNAMLLQNMLPRHVASHYTRLIHRGAISDNVGHADTVMCDRACFLMVYSKPEFPLSQLQRWICVCHRTSTLSITATLLSCLLQYQALLSSTVKRSLIMKE